VVVLVGAADECSSRRLGRVSARDAWLGLGLTCDSGSF
jgi:hypothetical protein